MPFNTRNPIPSGDLRDLDDNARNIDTWANDKTKLSHPDRFGVERYTWHGLEQKAQLDIAAGVADATAEAGQYRDQALDAKNAAQEAAMLSGFSKYADTLAQLESGIGTDYVEGDVVMVFQDESRGDTSSIFKIESGVAEFKLTFDKTRQDLLSFTGNISADSEWSDVHAHSDPAFDVQAQALVNRTEMLMNGIGAYNKIREYAGNGTRLKVQDPTGVHWWVRRGSAADNGGTVLVDALGRSWEREYSGDVNVQWFGAALDGIQDDAPALRRARDTVLSAGGGVITLPRGTLCVASYETRDVLVITSGGGQQVVPTTAALFVDQGISLRGAGSSHTKIKNSNGGIYSIVMLLDYKDAFIQGIDIEGAGSSNNAHHGLAIAPSASFDHVLENVSIRDVTVHHVGSYGISNNLQCRNVTLTDVRIWDTGSDGIDWKVRGATTIDGMISEGVVFSKIKIRGYGKRVAGGSSTGIGIRGRAIVDGIEVYGATSNRPGIEFVAGIASTASQDYRLSASNSSISNWYVEGADPKSDNIGLLIYASSAVNVGVGVAKWCKVRTEGAATTPYGFEDSGSMTSVTVIPAHGRTGFEFTAEGSACVGCRVISDKAYFDAKRNNLQDGQTVFQLPWDSSIANSVERLVFKNGVKLTDGDYSLADNTLTLLTPASASDAIIVVMPPVRGFRAQADYCSLVACRQDRHVPSVPSFATQSNYYTGTVIGFMWDGHKGVSEINSSTVAGLQSQDATVDDKDFRIAAKGGGTVTLGIGGNKLGFYASGAAEKQTVTGSRGGNEALNSLLTALGRLGLIYNNSTS